MADLTLKWGNVKGWSGAEEGTPFRAALDAWSDSGQGISAMQRQTPEQRELICAIIDAVDGDIHDDWNGGTMTKDAAKKYVREYGKEKV
jgi:hypothetical protein